MILQSEAPTTPFDKVLINAIASKRKPNTALQLWGGRYDTPQHGLVNIMIRFFEVMMEKKGGTSRYATVAVVIHLSSSSQASHVGN